MHQQRQGGAGDLLGEAGDVEVVGGQDRLTVGPAAGDVILDDAARHPRQRHRRVRRKTRSLDQRRERGHLAQARRFSMASQIITAISGPPKRLISRMPVGEVTLISVR